VNGVTAAGDRYDERFVVFDCEGDACIGVLARPVGAPASRVAVLIIVGGPQVRVGSHRQFALLARALAAAGIPTLRFDYRGMGDSAGDARTFEAVGADIAAALGVLQREAGVARAVLWGLCDGASAALMDGIGDPRVAGIVALNPWARSPQGEAATRLRHYYLQRLLAPDFWRKVFTGRFKLRQRAGEFAGAVRSASAAAAPDAGVGYLQRMEQGWARCRVPMLLILSGRDYTAREFETWVAASPARTRLQQRPSIEVCRLADADHTFSTAGWRDSVARTTAEWIGRIVANRAPD
jgi:exosortase A-associated hydrolase 1